MHALVLMAADDRTPVDDGLQAKHERFIDDPDRATRSSSEAPRARPPIHSTPPTC